MPTPLSEQDFAAAVAAFNSGDGARTKAWQQQLGVKPDGDAGALSWTALFLAAPEGWFSFPFAKPPTASWNVGMRAFGANRKGKAGPRAHAGCDLYKPAGTDILAVADGTVLRSAYDFYGGTDAVEIDHHGLVVRYCEIARGSGLRAGQKVKRGQRIADVGQMTKPGLPNGGQMLHAELYLGLADGPLTVGAANSKRHTNGRAFFRRKDLADPTPFLNLWAKNLPV